MLKTWAEGIKDQWANGIFIGESLETTALANVSAVAQMNLLKEIQELDFEKFSEVMEK